MSDFSDSFSIPKHAVEQCGLTEGMIVADFGSGSGFYSVAAAEVVGETGKVYSIDVQQDMLDHVRVRAQEHGVHNIEIIWGDFEHPGHSNLPDRSIDMAICANVFFQIEDPAGAVREISRVMKPGAQGLFVDWSESFGGLGPQHDHVFDKNKAVALLEDQGFLIGSDIVAGAHHYGFLFSKV